MSRGDDGDGRKIFIGGLPFGADEAQIREDFGKFGEIEDVYLPRERDTEKLRGFGFVTYKDARDARDASTDMSGREYHGRDITVNIARPRGERGGGGDRGGGFGGGDRGGGYGRDRGYNRGGGYDRGYERGGRERDYEREHDYDRGGRDRDYDRDRGYERGGGRDYDRRYD